VVGTATNMVLPQPGQTEVTSSFFSYCALAIGLDRSVDSIFDEMLFTFFN